MFFFKICYNIINIYIVCINIYIVPVFEPTKDQPLFLSVIFSPVDATLIASGGKSGTNLFDLRQNIFR